MQTFQLSPGLERRGQTLSNQPPTRLGRLSEANMEQCNLQELETSNMLHRLPDCQGLGDGSPPIILRRSDNWQPLARLHVCSGVSICSQLRQILNKMFLPNKNVGKLNFNRDGGKRYLRFITY